MKNWNLPLKTKNRKIPVRFNGISAARTKTVKIKKGTVADEGRKRVFVLEPFPRRRKVVADWLKQAPDLILCGEASNSTRALRAVERARPDVVVTDLQSQQNLDFIRDVHHRHPRLPILVVSLGDEQKFAGPALEAGADGYLPRTAGPAQVLNGIRATLEGRVVLSSEIRAQLLAKCWNSRG